METQGILDKILSMYSLSDTENSLLKYLILVSFTVNANTCICPLGILQHLLNITFIETRSPCNF